MTPDILADAPLAASIPPPSIAYGALSPMLIVFGVSVVGVVAEAFAPRSARYGVQLCLALGGLIGAFVALVMVANSETADGGLGQSVMAGSVVIDRPALFLQGAILLVSLAAVAVMGERRLERVVAAPRARALEYADTADSSGSGLSGSGLSDSGPKGSRLKGSRLKGSRLSGSGVSDSSSSGNGGSGGIVNADMFTPSGATVPNTDAEYDATRAGAITTEVFPLAMLSIGGMMLFGACGDLLTMFIALEVFSLPLYLLCGLARRRRLLSQEASLKYFLLGAFSSAFFLFGSAFVYGATGTLKLSEISAAIGAASDTSLAALGLALLSVGLLFKVGAVPFHSWIPDVYQGAPTPVTAFMASAVKIAAFGALLRVFYVGFGGLQSDWEPVLWVIAIATMLVGAIVAVTQTDVKRMLAYSAITHAGFLLLGVIAYDDVGLSATLFYLVAYGFSTLGAFATIAVVREPDRPSGPHVSGREATNLSQWAGLGRRYPLVGAMFSMFLLAFAGIPLTSGFIAKFAVFSAAAGSGDAELVVVAVISSAIAAYFYIRIIVAMFFTDPPEDAPHIVRPSGLTTTAIAVCTIVTIVLGIFPQPVLDLAAHAVPFLG